MNYKFYEKVEKWTKELVHIPSIVKGGTESNAAQYIFDEYKKLEYFQENPSNLTMQKTLADEFDRHSTLAFLEGNGKSNKTILLMGHIDTVEVNDYGTLKDLAFDPDELEEALKKVKNLDAEVKKDLDSGDYMFGRGALDMKSGVAGHMAIMSYFAEHREELNGNLVALAECDEEDGSHGVISALKILRQWKEEKNLDYILAINADYSTPYYPKDPNRYVYLGTIGKLLPSFFIAGKETHVGQAFAGYDPNLLLANLTRKLTYCTDFCDTVNGETTIPPMSLKQEDLKEMYTVQTALYAHGFYNFFTHGWTPKDVLEKLKIFTEETIEELNLEINEKYKKWCALAEFPYEEIDWKVPVYTWDEFENLCRSKHSDYDSYVEAFKKDLHVKNPNMDLRDYSLAVVREVFEHFRIVEAPAVVLYYSSVYSQNIDIIGKNEEEKAIINALNSSVDKVQEVCPDPIKVKYFYPYISDSSFVYLPDEEEGILAFQNNIPAWGEKFIHPVEDIRSISMPTVNIGTYGKDGHKNTERVHKEFTFEIIPRISFEMIKKLFKD